MDEKEPTSPISGVKSGNLLGFTLSGPQAVVDND